MATHLVSSSEDSRNTRRKETKRFTLMLLFRAFGRPRILIKSRINANQVKVKKKADTVKPGSHK